MTNHFLRSISSYPTIRTDLSSEPEELGGNHAMDLWRMQCLDAIPSEADFEAFTPQQRKREHEHVGVGINDLTALLFTYLLIAYKWIVFFSRNALEIAAVSTYVTGFWEVIQTQKYRFGPVPFQKAFGPICCDNEYELNKCTEVYILVSEVQLVFKHSLWPTIDYFASISDGNPSEPDSGSCDDSGRTLEYPKEEFEGQLKYANKMQRATYVALFPVRAICLAFVRIGDYITPRPTRLILSHRIASVPVPSKAWREMARLHILFADGYGGGEAYVQDERGSDSWSEDDDDGTYQGNGVDTGKSEWHVPDWVHAATDSSRIQGRAAFEAARRAGWSSKL